MTTNGSSRDHDGRRLCGGPLKQREGTCTQAAGWGTPHPGVGRCKLHGGSTPSHVAAAQRVQAEQLVQSLVWDLDAPPITDPVPALQSLAGRLDNAARVLGARLDDEGLELDSATAVVWARILRELRQALEGMERLGIAHRQVELAQGQAELVMAGLLAVLELLGPSAGDRERAVQVFLGKLGRGEVVVGELEEAPS